MRVLSPGKQSKLPLIFLRGGIFDDNNEALIKSLSEHKKNVVIGVFGSKEQRLEMIEYLKSRGYRTLDFNYAPGSLYSFLRTEYAESLYVVAPQYHIQMVCHLAQTDFLPVTYDKKNDQLHKEIGVSKSFDYWSEDYPSNVVTKVFEELA